MCAENFTCLIYAVLHPPRNSVKIKLAQKFQEVRYVNFFMGKLEREFLWTQDKIPQKWWSYTDDTFAIWTHGEPSLKLFIYNPDHHHSSIKFTVSWSAKGVTFLKTRVYLRDGLIGNDLSIKPTDTHQYLQMDICNARHCKTSIPYSQALHLHQICSEEEYLLNCTQELKKTSIKREYSELQSNHNIHQALAISRENCMQSQPNQDKSAQIPLVVTYHPIYHLFNQSPSSTFLPYIPENNHEEHSHLSLFNSHSKSEES